MVDGMPNMCSLGLHKKLMAHGSFGIGSENNSFLTC